MERKESLEGTQNADTEAAKIRRRSLPTVPDPSDPDDDDLDDLDDLLDDFEATKVDTTRHGKQPPKPTRPDLGQPSLEDNDKIAADFSKQLQAQMAALMGEVDESPEMKREIEIMMKELGATADPGSSSKSEGRPQSKNTISEANAVDESFQETIRKTMHRMQASGKQASAAASSEDPEDILTQMLKQMQGDGLESTGNKEDFSHMLMGMMEQLTTKEILYEPMKELHDKFPAWMIKNKGSTEEDELHRYKKQQRLVAEIVGKFETKGYSDSYPADREYIVERMQEMQAAGSPPADLAGDMHAAQEVLGDIDPSCTQQ